MSVQDFPAYETLSIDTTLHLDICLYMKSTFLYIKYIVILLADFFRNFGFFGSSYFCLADYFRKQAITKF